MDSSSGDRNPVEELAEEFLARRRNGEKPTLAEYAERYPELAGDIRELFPALLMMEDLGDSSLAATGPHEVAGPRLPERVGDYRILREVGRGGMGVVYEAEQESLGRRVALKVLPPQALPDANQLRRFEREARAAAKLHHTNIVPVFGVGHDGGTHYYVMQFIQGQGLDEVLEELKRLRTANGECQPPGTGSSQRQVPYQGADAPRSQVSEVARSLIADGFAPTEPAPPGPSDSSGTRLPGGADLSSVSESDAGYWRSVARLGVQVAEALAYAHGQGVLHRDIKPSNLLLDLRGTVWVTDFGLAKSGDAEDLTHTGDIVGTLRYMAPERFQGKSDARSDVYALGLTLYELVALKPAFAERDRPKLMQQVLHEEPARLRKVNRAVPRDLETIVHKTMAKEPERRYPTAAALAEDLQRFLEDRPIRARRAGPRERLWRWCRRNPAVASLSGALAVLLVTVAVVSIALAYRFSLMAQREQAAAAGERTARDEADGLQRLAEEDSDRLNRANRLLISARRAVDRGQWAEAHAQLTEAVGLQPRHSLVRAERGNLYLRLGLWEEAAADAAEEFASQPADDDAFLWYRRACLQVYAGDAAGHRRLCAEALDRFGQTTQAQTAEWVVRICTLTADPTIESSRPVQLAQRAVAADPPNPSFHYCLGLAHYRAGQFESAVRSFLESNRLDRDERRYVRNLIGLALTYGRWGEAVEARRRIQEADGVLTRMFQDQAIGALPLAWWDLVEVQLLYHEAQGLVIGLPAVGHPWLWVANGRAHAALAQWDKAGREFDKAVELRSDDPGIRLEKFQFHADQRRWDQAAAEYAEAVRLRPNDPQLRVTGFRVFADKGKWDLADAEHQTAVKLRPDDSKIRLLRFRYHAERDQWEQAGASYAQALQQRPNDASVRVECGRFYHDRGMWAKALAELAEALKLRPGEADVWDLKGTCHERQGQRQVAVEHYSRAAELQPRVARYWSNCGRAHAELGDWKHAAADFARAIGLPEATSLDWSYHVLLRLQLGDVEGYRKDCARLLERFGKSENSHTANRVAWYCALAPQAVPDADLPVLLAEKAVARDPRDSSFLHTLGAILYRAGRFEAAVQRLNESLALHGSGGGPLDWVFLAMAHYRLGHLAEAHRRLNQALRAGPEPFWYWRLQGQLLIREAEALLPDRREATAYLREGRWAEAIPHLDRLIATDASHWPDRVARGRAYAHLGRWDEAAADYAKALVIVPDNYFQGFHWSASSRFCSELASWQAAFDQAVRLRPHDARLWIACGRHHARQGQWDQAAAAYAKGVEGREPEDHAWLEYASVLLLTKNQDGYEKACARQIKGFGGTTDPAIAHRLARLCTLSRLPGVDPARLIAWAKPDVDRAPNVAHPLHCLGAAYYRAGQWDQAVQQLSRSVEADVTWPGQPMNWVFLAMAYSRQGKADDAKPWLDKVEKWLDDANRKIADEPFGFPERIFPADWLIVQALRREAEALLADPKR